MGRDACPQASEAFGGDRGRLRADVPSFLLVSWLRVG